MFDIPEIRAEITTRTPIWTGNRQMKMDGVKETGILGSLRWWYEAIIRGFGYKACDPVVNGCQYDTKRAENTGNAEDGFRNDEGNVCVCPACQLFGCTGWGKRFRMRWYDDNGSKFKLQNAERNTYRHNHRNNKGYYICSREANKEGGRCRAVFYPSNDRVGQALMYLLRFAERWGGFGARPQFGYGMCDLKLSSTYAPVIFEPKIAQPRSDHDFPDMRDFFFCQFEPAFKNPDSRKMADCNYYTIESKYRIREGLRLQEQKGSTPYISKDLRHYICGEVRGNTKNSSKIFISRKHRHQGNDIIVLRGYLPRNSSLRYNRDDLLELIFDTVDDKSFSNGSLQDNWYEYESEDKDEMEYGDWLQWLIKDEKGEV